VEGGQIRLPDDAVLPDHTRVIVVVPGQNAAVAPIIASPRLVDSADIQELRKTVIKASDD